jgi:NAD(P)H dehydrogenase (quinone)
MGETKILVMGAPGGTQGSTAGKLVRLLREADIPVRVLAHNAGARSQALAQTGAQLHVGDMLAISSVRAAMRGIEKVYFCYPVKPGLLEATAIAAQVGKEEHIQFLVNLSQAAALDESPSPTARYHWLSERLFDWSGIPVFHLRGGVFFENLARQFAKGIVQQDQLKAPFGNGEGKIPLVDAQDIARVTFAALHHPESFSGMTVPIFSELLSLHEYARQISEVLGRSITYHEISSADWLAEAVIREGSENTVALDHLLNLWKLLLMVNQSESFIESMMNAPHLLPQLTGQPGRSLRNWLEADTFQHILNADGDSAPE